MTTTAYALIQLIRRSRAGTRCPTDDKIEFLPDADIAAVARFKGFMQSFESMHRGHMHLLRKPKATLTKDELSRATFFISTFLRELYSARWLLTPASKAVIDSLPPPEKEIEYAIYESIASARLGKLAAKYPGAKVNFSANTGFIQMKLTRESFTSEEKILTNALSALPVFHETLGEMFEVHTKLFRELEKLAEDSLRDEKRWPTKQMNIDASHRRIAALCSEFTRGLSRADKQLLSQHPHLVSDTIRRSLH